jgi:hypothetical protein
MLQFSSNNILRMTQDHHTLLASLLAFVVAVSSSLGAIAQGAEWTEKDLAKNVHRAEEAFEAGEMSRAYGLFAHLVSIAEDRPFLHFRFGAICTFTSDRLNEAEEHLHWAQELGILETEHASEWNFYQGRLAHLKYDFKSARAYYRVAIDDGKTNATWMNNAKLYFGQCSSDRSAAIQLKNITGKTELASHSEDYFRLYNMPIEDGRLLETPDQLRSKRDIQEGYTSTMHWLPGKRYAFYSSYGPRGNTGLDIYRVSVDGLGEYGTPEKLPAPINSDFDDCAPICIIYEEGAEATNELYFSSARPESFGGFDIFLARGNFSSTEFQQSDEMDAHQLPMEINSTSDEWLYYVSPNSPSQWISTNRDIGFEGKEVWEFSGDLVEIHPTTIRFQINDNVPFGALEVKSSETAETLFVLNAQQGKVAEYMIQSGASIDLVWKNNAGVTQWVESWDVPSATHSQIALESLIVGQNEDGSTSITKTPSTCVQEKSLGWTATAMKLGETSGIMCEQIHADRTKNIRRDNKDFLSIQRILLAHEGDESLESSGAKQDAIPSWLIEALAEVGGIDLNTKPEPVHVIRSKAVQLQTSMEMIHCWDAPGSNQWELRAAIKRFGEPALGVLSEQTRNLEIASQGNAELWENWQRQVKLHLVGKTNISEDWLIIDDYINAQVQSNQSAMKHVQDMYRRIEAHLVYDRWVTDAFPMDMPEFRKQLITFTANNSELDRAITFAANETSNGADKLSKFWLNAQAILWNQLTDSIVNVHDFEIYSLPEMESAQSWFIRSGGLLEDAKSTSLPAEQISRGQAAVGLAWEAYNKGAQKRDLVTRESKMSTGEWWQMFGADSGMEQESREGFEMFIGNNSTIVQQAELYFDELDIIRTKRSNPQAYRSSMTNAIAMRSNLEEELNALFGGTVVENRSKKEQIAAAKDKPVVAAQQHTNLATAPSRKVPKLAESQTRVAESLASKTADESKRMRHKTPMESNYEMAFAIQIGAFKGSPAELNIWFKDAYVQDLGDGMNRYLIGSFITKDAALAELERVKVDVPDAFIKSVKRIEKSSSSSNKNVRERALPNKKEFRLKITEIVGELEASQAARLLRLGNQVPIQSTRSGNRTLYFSESFSTFQEAERALSNCIAKGYTEAQIQIVN